MPAAEAQPVPLLDRHHSTDRGPETGYAVPDQVAAALRPEFANAWGGFALQTLVDHFEFSTVLDVGCGEGLQTELFRRHGKRVTGIDYGVSEYFRRNPSGADVVVADFNTHRFDRPFDCVWASHVLEHQPNVKGFLRSVAAACRPGGLIAITVPPLKHQIVGGHVTLWNAGLVLYNLAVAGIGCREASVCKYGYNICVIVRHRPIDPMPRLAFDYGDIKLLAPHLPPFCTEPFEGDWMLYNWPGLSS